MARAFVFVLDSVGIGGAPDASAFGDEGSNTVGHIIDACLGGDGDSDKRSGALTCPNLAQIGFFNALELASGHKNAAQYTVKSPTGFYGAASEISHGKDTPSGHWEIAGVPVLFDWGYFPQEVPAFPLSLMDAIYEEGGIAGSLCNAHGSGTQVIAEYGEDHIRTGNPIFYTSADSVLQIAAHEEHFGLEQLYALCETARALVNDYNIGRVIARPFLGDDATNFERTGNRRDYSVVPPAPTLLDWVVNAGGRVLAVGKIGDIFAHQGISEVRKANGNAAIGDVTLKAMQDARDGDLVFSNFVDFDMLYGHRRDVPGYALALEDFDKRLPEFIGQLRDGDLLIITADHGCDPTWQGTDHTRERVPVIGTGPGFALGEIGIRDSFADIAATLADHLSIEGNKAGVSFLPTKAAHA